jgi:DNA-binding response OmpR family regulator
VDEQRIRVLVIDDEPNWVTFSRRVLARRGYAVSAADFVPEDVSSFESYRLVLINSGLALAALRRLKQVGFKLVIMVPGAISVPEAEVYGLKAMRARLVKMPFSEDSLIRIIQEALSS